MPPIPNEVWSCLLHSQGNLGRNFGHLEEEEVSFLQSMVAPRRCSIPKKLSASCLWSLEKKREKRLDLESYIFSLKRSNLQGLSRKIKSKLSRSLSHASFERLLFLCSCLVVWLQNFHRHRAPRAAPRPPHCLPHSQACPAAHSQAWHDRFYGRQLAKRSLLNVKHWPKVNSHPHTRSQPAPIWQMCSWQRSAQPCAPTADVEPHCGLSHPVAEGPAISEDSLHLPQNFQWWPH